jgi:hypothetical protein
MVAAKECKHLAAQLFADAVARHDGKEAAVWMEAHLSQLESDFLRSAEVERVDGEAPAPPARRRPRSARTRSRRTLRR